MLIGGKLRIKGVYITPGSHLTTKQGIQNIVIVSNYIRVREYSTQCHTHTQQESISKKAGPAGAVGTGEGGFIYGGDKFDALLDLINEAVSGVGLKIGIDVGVYLDIGLPLLIDRYVHACACHTHHCHQAPRASLSRRSRNTSSMPAR